ncbi:MAG: Jag N-terminal domain-containing protein [Anaerolineae bacterium]|nr:Jag N-terminal domain-containing protein [Anaerolineae bacterium]
MTKIEQSVEVTGSNVDAAIAAGLARLGVDRETVEIEVLDGGSRGVLGLGARQARVRLTPKLKAAPRLAPAAPVEPEEPAMMEKDEAEVSRGVLLELLTFLGASKAQVDVRRAEPAPGDEETPLILNVYGPDVNALVGYRGETLAALQHITRLIVGREMAGRVHLVVDVDDFKVRREQTLRRLAQRMAEQAMRTSRTVVLEPMPPNERRIIHLALRDHPRVTTQSIGEGDRRKVTIIPQ